MHRQQGADQEGDDRERRAARHGDASRSGSMPSSARAWTASASSGLAHHVARRRARASSGDMPSARYISASSAVSAAGLWAISRRSIVELPLDQLVLRRDADPLAGGHADAAGDGAGQARPAARSTASTPPPAKPRISDTFDTSPSLTPNTAARADAARHRRGAWWWTSARDHGRTVPAGGPVASRDHRYARAAATRPDNGVGTGGRGRGQRGGRRPTPAGRPASTPHAVAEALGRLCDIAALRQPDDPLLVRFLPLYYSELPADDVDDRKLDDIYAVAVAHLALGRVRAPGACVARVLSPDRDRDGWQSQHSVLLVVTDDMPFLVDTMRMVLERHGLGIHLLVHPMLRAVARRAAPPRSTWRPTRPTSPAPLEAWTQIEIDRTDERDGGGASRPTSCAPSTTSSASSTTSTPMRDRMEALAAVDPILPWLADGQFVFLGAADYDVAADGDADAARRQRARPRRRRRPGERSAARCRLRRPVDDRPHRRRVARCSATSARPSSPSTSPACSTASSGCWRPTPTAPACSTIPGVGAGGVRRPRPQPGAPARPHRPGHPHRARGAAAGDGPRAGADRAGPPDVGASSGSRSASWCGSSRCASRSARGSRCSCTCRATASRPSCPSASPTPSPPPTAPIGGRSSPTSAPARWRASRSACAADRAGRSVDLDALERAIDELSTSWSDRLRAALVADVGEERARDLFERVGASAPPAYIAAVAPERAIGDIRRIADLVAGDDRADDRRSATTSTPRPVSGASASTGAARRRRCPSCCPCSTSSASRPSTSGRTRSALGTERVYLYDIGVRVRRAHRPRRAPAGGAAGGVPRARRRRDRERLVQPPRAARRAQRPRGRRSCAATASTCARSGSPSASATSRTRSPPTRRWSPTSWPCSTPASIRPVGGAADDARRDAVGRGRRADHRCPRRHPEPRRRPHLPGVPHADQRHRADELLPRPAGDRRQARPGGDPRPAGAAAEARDLGVRAAGRGRPPPRRRRSPAAGCAGATAGRTSAPRCSG